MLVNRNKCQFFIYIVKKFEISLHFLFKRFFANVIFNLFSRGIYKNFKSVKIRRGNDFIGISKNESAKRRSVKIEDITLSRIPLNLIKSFFEKMQEIKAIKKK